LPYLFISRISMFHARHSQLFGRLSMIIPYAEISPEILDAILKEFVLREGTDYGLQDVALEDKIEQVKAQLVQGSAVIVFSELHQTVNIMPAEQFNAANHEE